MTCLNIFTSLSPFYKTLSYIGAMVFTIDYKIPAVFITKWNCVSIIFIIGSNLLLSCSYWNIEVFMGFRIQVAQKSEPFLLFMDHAICVFTIYWTYRHRHGILKILNILNEIDEVFLENEIKIDHNGYRRKTMMTYMFCYTYAALTSIAFAYLTGFFTSVQSFILSSFSIWIYWMSISFQLHFLFIIHATSKRCKLINIWIQKYPLRLKKISRIHLRIVEILKLFNSIFSQLMLLIIASLFSWNCFGAFAFTMMKKSTRIELISAISLSSNLIFFTILFICNIQNCERILESMDLAIESLYNLKNKIYKTGYEFNEEVTSFIHQILHTNIRVHCKFFDLNWRFLFQVSI